MKRIILWLIVVLALGGIAAAATPKLRAFWKERNRTKFRTDKVTRGDITFHVNATGRIEPVLKVQIGSFVSGPIVELHAEFNQKVKKGDLLAKVDPRIYDTAVLRDDAALLTAKAELNRVQSLLDQARNDERRAQDLKAINPDYISDSEMDQFKYTAQSLEAQLLVAEQSIKQAEAQLQNSKLNLGYTDIRAESDGIIIDRKIDPGQTLTAQFQTPELFVMAVDMDQRMWVHAGVVEADIGHILRAQDEGKPVQFSVDAYEGDLFTGQIHQVRQNPTTDQNVVTYPVIVETPNQDMKLLPGMTATLSFEIDDRKDVLRVPGTALRYLPSAAHLVRKEDRKLIEGTDSDDLGNQSAEKRVEANRKRRLRHVWVKEGDLLRAIEVELGITEDGKFFELVSGDLKEDQELVVGVEEKK